MSRNSLRVTLAVAVAIVLCAANAQATLIAYDGFSGYTAGANAMVGENYGTGWTNGWPLFNYPTPGTTASITATSTGGPTYLNLVATPSYMAGVTPSSGGYVSTGNSTSDRRGREFAPQSSGILYFSQLLYFGPNEANAFSFVGLRGLSGANETNVYLSPAWSTNKWSLVVANGSSSPGTNTTLSSPTAGSTYFVVGKIEFDYASGNGTNDKVSMYINPTSLGGPIRSRRTPPTAAWTSGPSRSGWTVLRTRRGRTALMRSASAQAGPMSRRKCPSLPLWPWQ